MIKRNELFEFINHKAIGQEVLERSRLLDAHANGVQVVGSQEIEKVAIGVSVSMDFLKEAVADGSQACIFHHGLHLSQKYLYNSQLDPALQSQLKFALTNDLTIAGYHFALDHHPELGNNAQIIEKLGAKRLNLPYFDQWGWVGEFKTPIEASALAKQCSDLFEHDVFAVYGGPSKVKRIGVVSGGGRPTGKELFEIFDKKIDLHLTGEISESGPALAKDGGFNYFACGHYATEVFGVQALENSIKDAFKGKISVEFIDIANPL